MSGTASADDIIRLLELRPHPEGGHFRETFRDSGGEGRAASTAIYFLLKAGETSRWHAVDAAEVWHHYAGAPLLLEIAAPDGPAAAQPWRVDAYRLHGCSGLRVCRVRDRAR